MGVAAVIVCMHCAGAYTECVPQGADELAEAGPGVGVVGPAAGEQGVDGGRAERRFGESDS